jgi:hypothetical protein
VPWNKSCQSPIFTLIDRSSFLFFSKCSTLLLFFFNIFCYLYRRFAWPVNRNTAQLAPVCLYASQHTRYVHHGFALLTPRYGTVCGVVWCDVVWCGVVWCTILHCTVMECISVRECLHVSFCVSLAHFFNGNINFFVSSLHLHFYIISFFLHYSHFFPHISNQIYLQTRDFSPPSLPPRFHFTLFRMAWPPGSRDSEALRNTE